MVALKELKKVGYIFKNDLRREKKYIKLKNKYSSLEEYRIGGYHKSFLRKDVLRKK